MTEAGESVAIPDLMPAAVYQAPGEVTVEQLPVPRPGTDDVLIEVSHCGVCGTDLHMMVEGWGRPGTVFGHEYSGTVVACGREASGWPPGSRVVGTPAASCGECAQCRANQPFLCLDRPTPGISESQGAFARYVLAKPSQLHAVPASLGMREAALTEPLAVALHAIGRARMEAGDRVLVTGAGPIGALATAVLAARRHEVTVVEPNPLRAELAVAVGATRVVPLEDLDVPSGIEPDRIVDDAMDVVLECSGKRPAFEAGVTQLRKRGTIVVIGTGLDPPALDLNRTLINEITIVGAFEYDPDGFSEALAMLASGGLPTGRLIEGRDVALDGLPEALGRLSGGEVAGKQLVDLSHTSSA